jgi:hypothetical protein
VNEFVEECRREWRRLGVPDPVANEMAADLTADLEEAEAEGGSLEDVLGNSAFDPRRFAAAWATARGVTGQPTSSRLSFLPRPVAVVLTALLAVLIAGAGLVVLTGRRSASIAVVTRRIAVGPGTFRLIAPGPGRFSIPGPLGSFVGKVNGPGLGPIALILLIVGLVGLGLLVGLYWSHGPSLRRSRRNQGPRTPSWN